MAESNGNGKLPVGIVNTVINKISEFTKEMEVLRAQLPNKDITNDKIDLLNKKVDKTLTVIKTVFVLAMIVVGLSFLGAKLLDWHNETDKISNKEVIEQLKDEMREERSVERAEDKEERKAELEQIFKKMEELHDNKKGTGKSEGQ
jgi:hypothetical protein